MAKKFDAIIVGAGPAGSSAAYAMAKEGLSVLMIERGEYPGSKNMFGGMVYCQKISKLYPTFWEEAPLERVITKHRIVLVHDEASISLNFEDATYANTPANSCTVFRSKFDKWLAQKALDAGALVMNDTVVDGLLWNSEKVIGVKVRRDEGEVYSDVVILAGGANCLLTSEANLVQNVPSENFSLGVKELIALPKEVIDERFNVSGSNGAAYLYMGYPKGLEGGGFIYTNKKSLSIGVVFQLNALIREKVKPWQLMEDFKSSPAVRDLVKDGVLKEYSARIIPEGGFKALPKLFAPGVLVVGSAAGFVINNGFSLRGVDLAIASGTAAANTIKMAQEKGDMSEAVLSKYQEFLKQEFVLQDLLTYKNAPDLMHDKNLYDILPKVACEAARRTFSVLDGPRQKTVRLAKGALEENMSLWQFLKYLLKIGKSL